MAEGVPIKVFDDLARDLNRVEKERDRLRKKNKHKTVIIARLREDAEVLKAIIMLRETILEYYEGD